MITALRELDHSEIENVSGGCPCGAGAGCVHTGVELTFSANFSQSSVSLINCGGDFLGYAIVLPVTSIR
jgi:hypothetical protein